MPRTMLVENWAVDRPPCGEEDGVPDEHAADLRVVGGRDGLPPVLAYLGPHLGQARIGPTPPHLPPRTATLQLPVTTVMNTATTRMAAHTGRPYLGEEDDLAIVVKIN